MKVKLLFSTLLMLSAATALRAQYFDPHTNLLGKKQIAHDYWHLPKAEGYTLDLGHGNKLFIPRANSYPGSKSGLSLLKPTHELFEAIQKTYDQFKDSLNNPLTVKKLQYVSYNGRVKTLVSQRPPTGEKTYYTSDGKTSIVKPQMDSVTIAKVDSTGEYYKAGVLVFTLNSVSDFNKVVSAGLVDRFIDSIEATFPAAVAKKPYWKNFVYGNYTLGNGQAINGTLKSVPNLQRTLSLGFSADIQNIKNRFVPSASIGISLFNNYKKQPDSYNGFGLYWTPYFFFEKDAQGKTQTYRNDFLFATYSSINNRADNNSKLDIYLPISLGYLIHRKGDFLEKNTFSLNAFGVKYGNATLKPYIYFNNFFKGVTPSIQLSISLGK